MMTIYMSSVGLVTPGMPNWKVGQQVLSGHIPLCAEPLQRYKPQMLPPNERRRATELVRMAFRACEDAVYSIQQDLSTIASVFATSGGDYQIVDQICRTLKTAEHAVSPTQFHNSVHNAAAGYWSIATGSHAPSVCLAGYDTTFATGLLEAASFIMVEKLTTLYTAYDMIPPSPLSGKRAITAPFAVALLLTPEQNAETIARLELSLIHEVSSNDPLSSVTLSSEMRELVGSNPAAQSIPLLKALTQRSVNTVGFTTNGKQHIKIIVTPLG